MKSKTSFFNKTLFWNNTQRFWPVWAAYLVIWFFILPFMLASNLNLSYVTILGQACSILDTAVIGGTLMSAVFGAIFAMAVFSYLYTTKNTGLITSLPITRETTFWTNYLSGIIWMLVSNVIIVLMTLVVSACFGMADLLVLLKWFLIVSLNNILFYGLGVFCGMLTGHILVLPCVYVVFNFVAVVVESLFKEVLEVLVYGMRITGGNQLAFLSPVIELSSRSPYIVNVQTGEVSGYYHRSIAEELGDLSQWIAEYDGYLSLAVYAFVGIVFAVIAFYLYRRRQMETATDVVSVRILRPVFKYCMCFGSALVLGTAMYFSLFSGYRGHNTLVLTLCMLLGSAVGYFSAEMLMQKTFRVFKSWKGYGIGVICVVLVVCVCEYDVFGYERFVPEVQDVECVTFSVYDPVELREAQNVEAAIKLHESIINNKDLYESSADNLPGDVVRSNVDLMYEMKNGDIVKRRYSIYFSDDLMRTPSSDAAEAQKLCNTKEAIQSRKDLEVPVTLETISFGDVDWYDAELGRQYLELTPEQTVKLYDCITKDMNAGNIGILWLYTTDDYYETTYDCRISIEVTKRSGIETYDYDYFYTYATTASTYTNAYLRELGVTPELMLHELEGIPESTKDIQVSTNAVRG